MRSRTRIRQGMLMGVAAACVLLAAPRGADAVRERKTRGGDAAESAEGKGSVEGALEADRLFDRAQELLDAKETERAVRMFESILEQYPNSQTVHPAALALGRYYLSVHDQAKAIPYLNRLRGLEQPGKELTGDEREWYLESLYLTGVAYFQTRRYGEAFPVLRRITTGYSGTVWANQAYYYIGMCHFAQQNWSKAIEALNLVGAFIDPSSPTAEYAEAGRRFYIRVEDRDLPVLSRMGKKLLVKVETAHGDREQTDCVPLAAEGTDIGSLPTEVGVPRPGDGTLQVTSGDTIVATYTDEVTEDGVVNLARTSTVKVVSSGTLAFMLGDYETAAAAAYLDQPCFLHLQDADLDATDGRDSAEVSVISRYKEEAETAEAVLAAEKGEVKYVTRDKVTLRLTEVGTNSPTRTGRFGGNVAVVALQSDAPVNQSDAVLACQVGDELAATYADALGIEGPSARTVTATLPVLGELDSRPRASQDIVFDPLVRSKKNLVESAAYLELARIFRSMGLLKGAKEKVVEGVMRTRDVIRLADAIPLDLRQQGYKLTWELYIAGDDFANAMSTCHLFNRLYPDSPIVDEALMGMARIRMENRQYTDAVSLFRQVLGLARSDAKGEAQFRIGEATEAMASSRRGDDGVAQAIQEYKICAERYPDSPFAADAIAKVVDYYIAARDFAQAGILLEQVFTDHPDAAFLDSMLLKWTLVAYQSGDYAKARDKCAQLISEYPESSHAQKAKQILPKIEAKLNQASGGAAAGASQTGDRP